MQICWGERWKSQVKVYTSIAARNACELTKKGIRDMELDNEKTIHTAYLGLGSNLGDREATIGRAIEMIGEQAGTVEARSALFYSEPWGFESEHGFVNAVVRISTDLSPNRLLKATQRIERQLGKTACHATERPLSTRP